jgi:hypothetical protein
MSESPKVTSQLTARQLLLLQQWRPMAILSTADPHGRPHVSVVSWLHLVDAAQVTIALDRRTQHFKNIGRNPSVALSILADGLILAVSGTAEVCRDRMAATPWETAQVRVAIDFVVDQTLPGVEFVGPRYSYPDGKEHRYQVEDAVLAELAEPWPTRVREILLVDDRLTDPVD